MMWLPGSVTSGTDSGWINFNNNEPEPIDDPYFNMTKEEKHAAEQREIMHEYLHDNRRERFHPCTLPMHSQPAPPRLDVVRKSQRYMMKR